MPEVSSSNAIAEGLLEAAARLREETASLSFPEPVHYVYNPLEYAWPMFEAYVRRYVRGPRAVVFMGMNPGPFGMAQTGIPFGEVAAVRDWLQLEEVIESPPRTHPKRPIQGLECPRSEVSGKRLWGLFAERFRAPESFFTRHYVLNYCPLLFLGESGRNLTPDKISAEACRPLLEACDRHLAEVIEKLGSDVLVAVGTYAEGRAQKVLDGWHGRIHRILHPSPASPAANKDWKGNVSESLTNAGIW